MTTGTSLDDGPAGRRWAAGLLGVEEDAPRAEVRRAYLVKLREDDFQPSRSLLDALRVLEGKGVLGGIDEDRLLEEETRRRAEVESFAELFFTFPVAERRRRWDELLSGCRSVPPLAARLRVLQAGLEVDVGGLPSDEYFTIQLAEQLLHAFALLPLAQATSRQGFLRRIEEPSLEAERSSWEKAARRLRAKWPVVAALDDELVRHVAELRRRLGRRAKLSRRVRQQQAAAPAGSSQGIPWWVGAIVVVAGALLRGLSTSNNSPSERAPSSGYTSPVAPDLDNGPTLRELCDPSKFDVEVINPETRVARLLRFTPRPGSTLAGPNRPRANDGPPLMYGEVILRLRGLTPAQIQLLASRAEKAKRPDDPPKTPPDEKPRP